MPAASLRSAVFLLLKNNYRTTGMEVGRGTGGEAVTRRDGRGCFNGVKPFWTDLASLDDCRWEIFYFPSVHVIS